MGHTNPEEITEAERLRDVLEQRFGTFMTSAEVRSELKFKSASAFSMARKRGHVSLEPTRMPGRRQFVYCTREVAQLLARFALGVNRKAHDLEQVAARPSANSQAPSIPSMKEGPM